jgi:hypothetical protein
MKKKLLGWLTILTLAAGALGGCASSGKTTEGISAGSSANTSDVSSASGSSAETSDAAIDKAQVRQLTLARGSVDLGSAFLGASGAADGQGASSSGDASADSDDSWLQGGTFDYFYGTVDSVYAVGDDAGNSGLQTTLTNDAVQERDELATFLKSSYDAKTQGCHVSSDTVFLRVDSLVLSYLRVQTAVAGGDSGSGRIRFKGVNLNPETGEELLLKDFVQDESSFADLVQAQGSPINVSDAGSFAFAATHNGLLLYPSSDQTSWPTSCFIPFAGNEKVFTKRALTMPGSWAEQAVPNGESAYLMHLSDAGTIALQTQTDEYNTVTKVEAKLSGGEAIALDGFADGQFYSGGEKEYLVHRADGSNRVYISITGDGGSEKLAVYDPASSMKLIGTMQDVRTEEYAYDKDLSVSAIGEEEGEDEEGGISPADTSVFTDPEQFRLYSVVSLLGTTGAYQNYAAGEDGMPQATEPFASYEQQEVKKFLEGGSTVTLSGVAVNPETLQETGETQTIQAGEPITARFTDKQTCVIFEKQDGTLVKVAADSSWPITLDGKDVQTVFPNAFFAG